MSNFINTNQVNEYVDHNDNLSVGENLYQKNKLSIAVPKQGDTSAGGWKYQLHLIDLPKAFAEVTVNKLLDNTFAGGYMLNYDALDSDTINKLKWLYWRNEGAASEGFKAIRVSGINKKGDHLKRLVRVLIIESPEASEVGTVKLLKMGTSLFDHYKKLVKGNEFKGIKKRNPHQCTMTISVEEGIQYTDLYKDVSFGEELSDAEMTKRVNQVKKLNAPTLDDIIAGCPEYFNPSDDVKYRILENAGFDIEALKSAKAAKKIAAEGTETITISTDENTAKDKNGDDVPF